ncbi:histidine--tRNA ligase, partial [bacterium]|nr:histidine--tRNA ligase [bacterium]
MINIPKGTKDVLPFESYKWHYLENTAREVAKCYGYKEIRTPVFENTELFLRGVGDTTDIVNKEMYTFIDKGGRSMTLKPEGTAGVARSFIENGLDSNMALPIKMYYITPVFRYEKPQSGRLREHHQFGIELFGSYSPAADAEVISLVKNLFDRLKINEVKLYINSIGCPTCRKNYSEALKKYYGEHISDICPTCKERLEKNPLRLLDCKVDECIKIGKDAPVVLDYLCEDCKEHHQKLCNLLEAMGIDYEINPRIVRGLD